MERLRKLKRTAGLILALIMTAGMMTAVSIPAYAQADDPEPVYEPDESESADKADESRLTESDGAFTEQGNLTITDDVSSEESENMQFLTVTTRNGHTYYIVIDRNTTSQNVYFLNQVDERDLINLMSDEEIEELTGESEEESNPIVDLFAGEATPEPTAEPAEEKSSGNSSSFVILLIAAIGGAGIVFYRLKIKPKKKPQDEYRTEFEDDDEYIDMSEINREGK